MTGVLRTLPLSIPNAHIRMQVTPMHRFSLATFCDAQTRMLLGDLNGPTDSNYAGSIALALGCIHRR